MGIGDRLRVIQVDGAQVADLIAFDRLDPTERLSPPHTMVSLGKLFPAVGDHLMTDRRRPALRIVRDDVGHHDLLVPACDPWRYEVDFGVTGHANCSDAFVTALRPWSVARDRLPGPVNLFQWMTYDDGKVAFRTSPAQAGDVIELEAVRPLVVAVTACPMDLNPISRYQPTPIDLELIVGTPARAT
jgi:uncharacterized protein YcgI (DUF1989 family)